MRRLVLVAVLIIAFIPASVGMAQGADEPDTYIVQPGDTVLKIAARLGIDPSILATYNGITEFTVLHPGRVLHIPHQESPEDDPFASWTGAWVVRPGDTLYTIAMATGTTVAELADANNVADSRLITPGMVLAVPADVIQPSVSVSTPSVPSAASAPPPTEAPPPAYATGTVSATIADPIYLADGRWAEVYVTVTNHSVEPHVQTGYYYVERNPDGGIQYVTLLSVIHNQVPTAIIGTAPLWLGHVRFSDGSRWTFPAGCFYVETVTADGWEPTGPDTGFSWHVEWTGGFFDCGNSTHKIVPPIGPGQAATIPIYIYIQHPRLWLTDPPPGRSISQIDLEVFDAYGYSLGIVASRTFGP